MNNDRVVLYNDSRFKIAMYNDDTYYSLLCSNDCLLKRGTMIECEQHIELLESL